jgi:MFS family permease
MTANGHSPAVDPTPTRARYGVLALLCLLAMITYMDRAANGSAKTAIMADLNAAGSSYTEDDFFIVLMAFQLAYAIFEIPSGWLGDTRGPRSTLLRVVVWWSLFVALTGFTGLTLPGGFYVGFGALVVLQFLFGVGEAGAFPNIAKALYNWFPATDRGFAKSAVWTSARFMGGMTPLVWLLVTGPAFGGYGWREAMWLFAAAAALWAVTFFLTFRNRPAESRRVNAAELAYIDAGRTAPPTVSAVPWGTLVRSRNLWCVCLMYVVTNFCWYFLMYYLPAEMRRQFPDWKATPGGEVALAVLSGAPLLVGMFGCLLGGLLSDRYIRRTGDRKWGRRAIGMIGYAGAGLCYLAAAGVKGIDPTNLWLFALFLVLMGFMNDLIMAPAWAVCQDVGRQYAATVSGAMNMFGNLVGAVSGIFVTGRIMKGYSADPATGMQICFVIYAAVYFVGVGLWMLIDASKPVAPDEPAASS